ncbi:MAG: hypothetical protein EXR28_10530 [Betaproteobacteria bacterium]|nr:hypothetical protein [Betaproteobacteria bacterium]
MGYLSPASGPDELLDGAFVQELRRLGYIDGRNVQIEYRWAAGNNERLQEFAAELVRIKVDVIVASPTGAALAAKHATSTIPIVISTADPVGAGLVASLARPGGNVTGVAANSTEIAAKRLQLLREAVPKAARIALLVSNSVPGKLMVTEMRAAAKQMGFTLIVQEQPATNDGLATAFAAMQRARASADCAAERLHDREQEADRRPGWKNAPSLYVRISFSSRCGRIHFLRHQSVWIATQGRALRRPGPQGRQACGSASRTTHQVRVGHQPKNRQGA